MEKAQMPTTFARSCQRHPFRRPIKLLSSLRESAHFIIDSIKSNLPADADQKWLASFANLYGDILARPRLRQHCEDLAKRLQMFAAPDEIIFALQTIYSFLARSVVVQRLLPHRNLPRSTNEFMRLLTDAGFYRREFGVRNFLPALWDEEIIDLLSSQPEKFECAFQPLLELAQATADTVSNTDWQNTLTDLYEAIMPRAIRHDLGEYFTPYWLAQRTLEMAEFCGDNDKVVFDPGCGSGSFLLAAAQMKLAHRGNAAVEALHLLLSTILGCDLNPLSVLAARLNFLSLLATHFDLPLPDVELPILHIDTVFQTPLGNTAPNALQKLLPHGCDYLMGNPPWINWNCLPSTYREKLEKELLPYYTLFDFHGQQARLGHSNDDYLSTFALVTMHRYLRQHGMCSFVIKQPLLTNVAGKTFRHFEIRGVDGATPLRVIKVADLRRLNPFGIRNEAAIIVLQKGAPTEYPIIYENWSRENGDIEITSHQARPANLADVSSPWIVLSNEWAQTQFMEGHNPYPIRHGLKHDAAGILIMRHIERRNGHLSVQSEINTEAHHLEPEWIYPFLQPRHLHAWGLEGHAYFILPQHKAGENNIAELREHFPLTYAYLKSFEQNFQARRSKVFAQTPFYGLFGLGEYTFAPYKVCWIGLGFQPKFVVTGKIDDPALGQKIIVPDGTIYFISCGEREEAHYVCALLNSILVRTFLSARSGKSKRGLSKRVVDQLALPQFNRGDERHVYLAQISIRLHRAIDKNDIPADFEKIVEEVFSNSQNGILTHTPTLTRF